MARAARSCLCRLLLLLLLLAAPALPGPAGECGTRPWGGAERPGPGAASAARGDARTPLLSLHGTGAAGGDSAAGPAAAGPSGGARGTAGPLSWEAWSVGLSCWGLPGFTGVCPVACRHPVPLRRDAGRDARPCSDCAGGCWSVGDPGPGWAAWSQPSQKHWVS